MKFTSDFFSLTLNKSPQGEIPWADADKALKARFSSKSVGFYDWPVDAPADLVAQIQKCARSLKSDFEAAVIFGIGGSYLGAATIQDALQSPESAEAFPIHWVSNVDPGSVLAARHFLRKHPRSAAILVSKSGGTTETLSAFFHLARHFSRHGIVAITDPEKGELRRLATAEGWTTFPVPPSIGGRFSVLTAVGLLPAALCGVEAGALLSGARKMRDWLSSSAKPEQNAAYQLAAHLYLWDVKEGRKIQYLMPYWANLQKLGAWFVQLWGESLGKGKKGPTPVAALGTTDQHSLLQLFHDGPPDKVVGFVDVPVSPSPETVGTPSFALQDLQFLLPHTFDTISHQAGLATEKSVSGVGIPTYRIELPRLSGEALGALFFFLETACGFAGELYGVNAYDQPGVEEAKRLLKAALV